MNMKVFEFLYNDSCCESAAHTISIHKTKRGAEIAMEFHKAEIKALHRELYDDEHKENFAWDFNQSWRVRETELME